MFAASFVCLLIWGLQTIVGGAELAPPQNVSLITLNTNYTLSWDWPQSHAVTFTTQYVGKYKLKSKKILKWFTACEETSRMSCDLTPLQLHYLGIYVLRVRANANGSHSNWEMKEFCPDIDAALGPPTAVRLARAGGDLDVYISDPLTSTNISMKDHIATLYYHILYWENSADIQVQSLSKSANLVTLPNLKPWTWYCVKVQSRYDFYNKSSSFTSPLCMQTEGDTPWWQIFLIFLGSLILWFLVMLLSLYSFFWCYKIIKKTFFPSVSLPSPLKKDLDPDSDIPYLLPRDAESELLFVKVTVCAESTMLEIHNPCPETLLMSQSDLEPDSRHNRQDSSSSEDSGVYSTGCSLKTQQSNSSQSCKGAKDLRGGFFNLEHLKMEDIALGLKSPFMSTEKAIVDCV
ncbi:Interferon alpha/beta receptor 1a Membrane-associated type I interferon receptor [Channa argus]|uniref:Interferon alpha/beta receptor 1a Membrane-associated type I interferon receptor n=1 Tax=Channa argus TaxID=215402 RepID=A0A6G1PXZ1_CHAAH|nr:Interferon alpha/beta receptor 1a Membrane-associated type I interferon receptor [Channa argus]KAK2906411.1 hypothetical protein Q8A73_010354 [Channa argus]